MKRATVIPLAYLVAFLSVKTPTHKIFKKTIILTYCENRRFFLRIKMNIIKNITKNKI